ncbi:MAG: PKD domain-containing protein [Candidatus Atribacteria bacterium]|nr:MAG: PKD domain-containing protein [Candidatus Atribacteria bacterium]
MRRIASATGILILVSLALSLSGCMDARATFSCSTKSGLVPLEVLFDGSGATGGDDGRIAQYLWDFGDGNVGSGRTTLHTYEEPGTFTVELTIITDSGAVTSSGWMDSETISALALPTAAFVATPDEGLAPLEVSFDGTLSTPQRSTAWFVSPDVQRIEEFRWDFGDGATGEGSGWRTSEFFSMWRNEPVSHTYAAPGAYEVTLTVTCNFGYSDTVSQTITVGTSGGDADDEEDLDEGFDIGTITWEPGDEEEDEGDCVFIEGTVQNNGSVAAGVELTATAYNATSNPVGTFTYWPAGGTNIGVGVNYAYGFFLCDLSVPGEQVMTVEVIVTDAIVY